MSSSSDAPIASVDLGALRRNVAALRARIAPSTVLLASVKADAYGHGAAAIAPALQAAGAEAFGVATGAEAMALREAGVTAPVLVLGPVRAGLAELIAHDVALTVPERGALEAIEASTPPMRARVHLKVDTGMGRIGVRHDEAAALAEAVARSPHADLEGVYTHLACADEAGAGGEGSHTRRQLARFEAALGRILALGLRPRLVHAANSAALITRPETHYDLVRPGIAVYGHHASEWVRSQAPELVPVLTLSAPVTFVKRVRAGETVSYGARWTAPGDTVVATLRLGYADGYLRALGGGARMRLHGADVPVVGRVCMDQLLLDVGLVREEVRVGDRAVAFGGVGPDTEAVAGLAGTISYELLTRLGPRVQRCYVDSDGDGGRS